MGEPFGNFVGPRMKLLGDGGFILNPFAGERMGEAESPGVEHEAGDGADLPGGFGVDRVAEERVSEVAVVDADLMSAAGVESAKDEGGAIGSGMEKMQVSDGGLAGTGIANVHALSVHGMARDIVEDRLVSFFRGRLRDGEIELGGRAIGELAHEAGERGFAFGSDNATRGVFIEPVDNPGPAFVFIDGELAFAVVKESIDESAVGISGSGMDDHAMGFIEDDEIVVLMEDRKGKILRDEFGGSLLGDFH